MRLTTVRLAAMLGVLATLVVIGSRRYGFKAWDPEKLALDPGGDPGPAYPRLRPPTQESPRLFISYGWSRDQTNDAFETDLWVEAFAGFERIASLDAGAAVVTEWNHAVEGHPKWLTMIGIWRSGSPLPEPLMEANIVDVRNDPSPWAAGVVEMFPEAPPGTRGVPRLPAPERPPDPPGWPAYRPYD